MKSFSFVRLLNAMVNPGDKQAQRDADAELSVVERGSNHGGITIPPESGGKFGLSASRGAGAFNGGGVRCRCSAYRCSW